MTVKRRKYPSSLENFKKLKNYIKNLKNGTSKTDRQNSTRQSHR